ncbi:AfsR/SARP family transcriptional regulator [Kitasatospora aureofaciens]|uniref:AfsR/SARP family transcriptional regulator n=1 Tax=Kitasatospora aureofaciens TaxID=1894 RepID=UPI000AD9CB1D|nr:AfsR/SARP family transcriptional regulator [Kitasatospora aureofaciens]
MKFNILGPLEVLDKGIPCTPSALKVRWTLAVLLMNANRIVDLGLIIEEIWGSSPPRTVVTTAQTYIYQLRKLCRPLGREVILTKAPGYVLLLGEEELDAQEFERLHHEGDRLLAAGHPEAAAQRLRQALDLWRGTALADIPVGAPLAGHVAVLEEMRLRALEHRILADRQLGRHRELIPELRLLTLHQPMNEWYHEQLMLALDAAGRRSEALHVYRVLYRRLDEDLGIAPSRPLQELHNDLLSGTSPTRQEFQALAARAMEQGLRARSA